MMGGTSGLGDLDELYESIILDHYRNPRHTDLLESPDGLVAEEPNDLADDSDLGGISDEADRLNDS